MDDEVYAILVRIESGQNIFRPENGAEEGRAAFQHLVNHLLDLRAIGLIGFADGRITRGVEGAFILVGPCDLTPAGLAALGRDRALGPRSPSPNDSP